MYNIYNKEFPMSNLKLPENCIPGSNKNISLEQLIFFSTNWQIYFKITLIEFPCEDDIENQHMRHYLPLYDLPQEVDETEVLVCRLVELYIAGTRK